MPRAGEIDYTKVAHARPRVDQDVARGPEAPAGPHRARRPQADVHASCSASRSPRTASRSRGATKLSASADVDAARKAAPRRRRRAAAPEQAQPRNVVEMVDNRPTPDRVDPGHSAEHRHRQRRRADRRDHVVHEHVEPERAARRRPAREEGRRERAHGRAAHQDFARAGLARGHRLPDEGGAPALPREARLRRRRVRLHDVHRQRRRPDARVQRGDHAATTSCARRCSPATATSRRASIRTSRRTSSPRRRWSSRSRSPAPCSRT